MKLPARGSPASLQGQPPGAELDGAARVVGRAGAVERGRARGWWRPIAGRLLADVAAALVVEAHRTVAPDEAARACARRKARASDRASAATAARPSTQATPGTATAGERGRDDQGDEQLGQGVTTLHGPRAKGDGRERRKAGGAAGVPAPRERCAGRRDGHGRGASFTIGAQRGDAGTRLVPRRRSATGRRRGAAAQPRQERRAACRYSSMSWSPAEQRHDGAEGEEGPEGDRGPGAPAAREQRDAGDRAGDEADEERRDHGSRPGRSPCTGRA